MQSDRHARSDADARPDGAPVSTAPDPLLGRLLDGRYRITGRIARGGMATVYEAHDERLERTVALKVMHPGMGDDRAFAARFVREARSAAKLTHPNVVAVYDQGTDDGTVFLVMEMVPGETLRDVIGRQSPMPPARALAYLEPVLAALATAHRAGLMHRDVKPENVLIGRHGEVKVADFGLARAVTADTQHTATGVLIGTVSYLAPELVVEGRSDARADVYSAGVMLYELLTGRKPHTGESPIQVAYKHVHEDVPAPSRIVPGIPAYVDALVARATARERDLRPADAGVLLHQAHLVARALAGGVTDDPELVADLLPRRREADPMEEATPGQGHERTEVIPEQPWVLPAREGVDSPTQAIAAWPAPLTTAEPTAARRGQPPGGEPSAPRRRRRWPLLLLVLVLLGGAAGAIVVERDHIPFLNEVTVPMLAGSTPAAARTRLEQDGLAVTTGPAAYSNDIAKGMVVGTDPAAGDHTHKGDTVALTLSKGVEQYPVPSLAGKSLSVADTALARIKMVVAPQQVWSQSVPQGEVIRTSPAAGVVLRPGHAVTVFVSKGRQPIHVLDWTGKALKQARAALAAHGLMVKVARQYDDTAPSGTVLTQDPGAGHTFHRGDTITLTVSKGHAPVTVPTDLGGQGVGSARSELEGLGFNVRVQHYFPYFGLGYVMHADHEGDTLPYGATVTLYIS